LFFYFRKQKNDCLLEEKINKKQHIKIDKNIEKLMKYQQMFLKFILQDLLKYGKIKERNGN